MRSLTIPGRIRPRGHGLDHACSCKSIRRGMDWRIHQAGDATQTNAWQHTSQPRLLTRHACTLLWRGQSVSTCHARTSPYASRPGILALRLCAGARRSAEEASEPSVWPPSVDCNRDRRVLLCSAPCHECEDRCDTGALASLCHPVAHAGRLQFVCCVRSLVSPLCA